MLKEIFAEIEECKFLTKEDAVAKVREAYELGKVSGRIEEMRTSLKDLTSVKTGESRLEEVHEGLMDRLNTITV